MENQIKELMELGYKVEFCPGIRDKYFVTLVPLFGYNTKYTTDQEFKGDVLEEVFNIAISSVR